MTLDAIKEAIERLPEDERRNLADWFEDMEDTAWDDQIERDFSTGGRGAQFLREVQQEAIGGIARPLAEGLAKRRKPRS
jgi:hypothetical protein